MVGRAPLLSSLLVILCAACGAPATTARPPMYMAGAEDMAAAGPAVPPVYVHVDTAEPVMLQRWSTRDRTWRDVCSAPCDGYVPAFGSYRALPAGRAPTPVFTLPGPPGTRVGLAVDEDGRVWTRDSVQLRVQSRRAGGGAATWLAMWLLLRK